MCCLVLWLFLCTVHTKVHVIQFILIQSSPSIFRHPFSFINMLSGPWSITETVWGYREYFYGLGLAYHSAAIFILKATAVNNLQALEVSWPSPSTPSSSSSIRIYIFCSFFYLHAKRLFYSCSESMMLIWKPTATPHLCWKKVYVWGVWFGVHGASEPPKPIALKPHRCTSLDRVLLCCLSFACTFKLLCLLCQTVVSYQQSWAFSVKLALGSVCCDVRVQLPCCIFSHQHSNFSFIIVLLACFISILIQGFRKAISRHAGIWALGPLESIAVTQCLDNVCSIQASIALTP